MERPMTEEDTAALASWLQEKGVRCHHMGKKFEDATQMAVLLKSLFPRLVSLHNYSHCSSLQLKLNNWNYMNQYVLKRLRLTQTKQQILDLAKGVNGAIQALLLRVYKLEGCMNQPGFILPNVTTKNSAGTTRARARKYLAHSIFEASTYAKQNGDTNAMGDFNLHLESDDN